MALDATVGSATADSYLTLALADALASRDFGPQADKWLAATQDQKEKALRRASEDVDTFVGRVTHPWSDDQVLLFPRLEDVLDDDPFIPARVARAVYVQAAFLLSNGQLLADAEARIARGLANFSNPDGTGGTVEKDNDGLSPRAKRMLGSFTEGSTIGWIVTT